MSTTHHIYFMVKVKSQEQFERIVTRIATNKKATLFHCYICQDVFRISTAVRIQDFDFSNFKSEEIICNYIAKAIEILRQHIPAQDIPLPPEGVTERRGRLVFDDYTETIALLR